MNNITEIIFILDKSGSMGGLEKDTIGGYNSMLEKQKNIEGECYITTVLFDYGYVLLHDRVNIKKVSPMTEKEYCVGGATALLDAIGYSINKIDNAQRCTLEDYRTKNVMFVIITDGEENSSRKYTYTKIKSMIERQKEQYNWEFVFLGANIDAASTAERFGVSRSRAQNYHADHEGVQLNFCAMSDAVTHFRECSEISDDWSDEIESDFNSRKANHRKEK